MEHDGNFFEDGYYHSPKALATTLNGDKPGRVKLSYEPVTQKFIAQVKSKTKFTLYGDLPDILGFGAGSGDSSTMLAASARSMFVRASFIVDMRPGFESLYVYSSIVEPRIVADKIAPLLRIVPITGRHGEVVTAHFDRVQYIPMLTHAFFSVETEIRDDTDRPVPFECGNVTVTLHFRRCNSGLYRWITTTTMRGRCLGHCCTLQTLVSRGDTGLEVCSVVSSDRLPLWSDEMLSLWGSVLWRLECKIAGDVMAGKNVKKAQDEGQRLPEEIWCKASSTHHHLPVN